MQTRVVALVCALLLVGCKELVTVNYHVETQHSHFDFVQGNWFKVDFVQAANKTKLKLAVSATGDADRMNSVENLETIGVLGKDVQGFFKLQMERAIMIDRKASVYLHVNAHFPFKGSYVHFDYKQAMTGWFTKGDFKKFLAGEEIELVFNQNGKDWFARMLGNVFFKVSRPVRSSLAQHLPDGFEFGELVRGPIEFQGDIVVRGSKSKGLDLILPKLHGFNTFPVRKRKE